MKKPLKSKNGHTMITALAFMILLFALAGSILMIASYRYQKTYVRISRNQLYLYSTELVDIYSESIEAGAFNEEIARTVELIAKKGGVLTNYAKQYTFRYDMGKDRAGLPRVVENELSGEILDFKMSVKYEPQTPGAIIPDKKEKYVQIGDRITVEYRIIQKDEEIEYRIIADYYCKENTNVDTAGNIIKDDKFINMKWDIHQYKGLFYTK